MKQIADSMPLDIIPHPHGFITVVADGKDERGKLKIAFKFYDFHVGKITKATRNFYAEYKFGSAYKEIASQIKDYITCTVCQDQRDFINVVFPTGEIGIFDYMGTLIWTGDLSYHDSPVRGCAPDGNNLWCAVPDQNAIVRYSKKLQRVDFRIGGAQTTAIGRPMAISRYDDDLYVCCKLSTNIKKISLKDYVAEDYKKFEEPVLRYMRTYGHEVVVLSSGIYVLDM